MTFTTQPFLAPAQNLEVALLRSFEDAIAVHLHLQTPRIRSTVLRAFRSSHQYCLVLAREGWRGLWLWISPH